MATAVPSPLASSVEKTNGAKLNRLLIDGGTTVLRDIFDHHHLPVNLAADLHANYPKLNQLLKKKVLRKPQWDKLFPPSGVAPDSNTFDITLLFLLLTNMCGLSPPLSGWHRKPLPSDTSFEANLARIKIFRNVLYGHATSTGVDTPTFSSLWQEISTVLVSLGLDQAEIDRLKAEHCCEKDYLSVLLNWAESEEDIKSQLKDIHQSQIKTEETVKEVHKIQQEERRMQLEDHETLQHTKQAVEQMQQKHQEGHTEIQEVLKENQETLMQVKHKVENLEGRRNEDKEDEVLRKLAIVDTQRVIRSHAGKYQEGTRESIFEKVKEWLEDRTSENRVMVISGNAGMGKSVIAAVVCQQMHQAKRLSGSHFCQHDKARYRNPNVMLQSLASQLCDSLPEYKKVLVEKLSRNLGEDINNLEVVELFELLFEEPLSTLDDPGKNILMVIDGLDESEYQGRNDLLDVIANHFCELPVWIRFCVTTRPEINIADRLKKFKPLQLEPDDDENLKDIRLFFEKQLSDVAPAGYQEVVINELARKAEGLILYAYLLVDFIKNNIQLLTPEQLDSTLPSGISSVYQTYFQRLEKNLSKELTISEDQFLIFLSALVAARQPLPLDFVSKVLLSGANSLADQRKVKKAVNCISALLPVQDGCIHFFHKSVKDWLIDASSYGQHDFIVNENKGHLILSELSIDELDDVKGKGVNSTEFSDTTKYALQHGVHHMLELEESTRASSYEDVVDKYVADLELVYAKLCVNNSAASEDIVCVQKEDSLKSLSEESQRALTTLLSLLRKYHERFTTHPNVFFQTMLNEGGNLLSAKTATLLQNKYPKVSLMEYVHKETQEGSIQAGFRCSSEVACFDISPHYDYMVCECSDQTIHLWSLRTGKLLWKRPVTVTKWYLDKRKPFRVSSSSSSSVWSCYRSVVFHPAEDVVLPGILSDVYTFNGELKPLFPQSSCSFSVCSISGGKTKMLTDFPGGDECLILWSLKDGSEITRTTRLDEAILSFAWSPDERLLAISHISGLVCLVDAKNSFSRLAQVTIPKACGMIKFFPDLHFLYCWHGSIQEHLQGQSFELGPKCFRLNINESRGTFSLDVYPDNVDYDPCVYELPSKGGFLMGDPVSCLFEGFPSGFPNVFVWTLVEGTFAFVVNEKTVIRVFPGNNFVVMSSPDVVKYMRKASLARLGNIAFSLNADTVYGVTDGTEPTVKCISMDVSSRELKAKLNMPNHRLVNGLNWRICVVPVREGVLLNPSDTAVELWNFKLSRCVRRWSNLREVTHMMPISEERVACVGRDFKVHILDTTSKNIVNSIPLRHKEYKSTYPMFYREAIVCNRKYQLLSTDRDSVQLSDGTSILWKIPWEKSLLYSYSLPGMFSPAEEFVVISAKTSEDEQDVYVLDASSGNTLRTLCRNDYFFNCVFVSNEECVIQCKNILKGCCLRLFNVRSGHLLSVIDMDIRPSCLASCPQKSLIAVGLWCSHRICAFIQVKLPRDTDRSQSKRFELHQ